MVISMDIGKQEYNIIRSNNIMYINDNNHKNIHTHIYSYIGAAVAVRKSIERFRFPRKKRKKVKVGSFLSNANVNTLPG